MISDRICYIAGAGEWYGVMPEPKKDDLVIAADGGLDHLYARGLRVDVLIGDFDSISQSALTGIETITLPCEKDDTDMLSAIHVGLERGYKTFHIYGGTGGRLDHTLANIQCLGYLASVGARGYLWDDAQVVTAIRDGRIEFDETAKGTLSMFALGDEALGVSEVGLKYPLDNVRIVNTHPLGVSNEFSGEKSRVSVKKGTLIVVFPVGVWPLEG